MLHRSRASGLAGPTAVLALVSASFWPLVFRTDYTFLDYGDLVFQVLPWLQVQARAWQSGVFPLWDPHVWNGQSLLGQMQPGAAFPLNWPLFLAPFDDHGFLNLRWVHWHFVAMHALAGLAAYGWARTLAASWLAALFAGLAFAATGYVGSIWWPQMLHGTIWIPLTFLLARRATASRGGASWAWATLCGGAAGVSFLSGHHQAPLLGAVALCSYCCYLAGRRRRVSWAAAARLASRFAAAAGIAGLMAGLAMLPAVEYGRRAYRWVGLPEPVTFGQTVPREIHQMWSFSLSDFAYAVVPLPGFEISPFIGWATLALAGYALWIPRRSRETAYFAALAVVGTLYTLGPLTPVHRLIYSVVPLGDKARSPEQAVYIAQFALITLAALGFDGLRRLARRGVFANMVPAGVAALGCLTLFALPAETPFRTESQIAAGMVGLALACAGAKPRLAQIVLLGVLFFEANCGRVTRIYPISEAPVLAMLHDYDEPLEFLNRQPRPFRFLIRAKDKPNLGGWRGLDDSNGYLASVNRELFDFVRGDWQAGALAMNTVYEIAREPFDEQQEEVFHGPSGWNVYRNPGARPRVWFEDAAEGCNASADYRRIHLQRVEIEASLDCAATLVVADPYFPGWRVRVDGAEAALRPFNGALIGIDVKPGRHHIELDYLPASVLWGAGMSSFALVACGLAAVALVRTAARR